MRKCLLLMAVVCVFLIAGCGSSPAAAKKMATSYNGWMVVKVNDIASFQIPPTMEVQSEAYRQKEKLGVKLDAKNGIICQQKGLNELSPAGKKQYARVMFNTFPLEGQGASYGQPLNITDAELQDFGSLLKNSIIETETKFMGDNVKFLRWEPIKIDRINGVDYLHLRYERQLSNNPVVRVDNYRTFDKDRIHVLVISSRINEDNIWHVKGQDISNVVNTLQITPR